ncbi:hypothetical protein NQ176_g6097 [Zarea fungicola]|uniref:Uncharacterized protein n=1 Tax=Zarea fungicola TaxID=93591 RepID=A0ACC1N7D1_9HYPO|nr:hypothetical protein NQ176_g6097 [Lecanicillium fungicola]
MLIPDNTEYPLLVLKYKHDCIRALRAYLVQDDDVPDDVTIALAFILLTEEYLDDNIRESSLHNKGIMRMVSSRGFDGRGPSGVLGLLLGRCKALKVKAVT